MLCYATTIYMYKKKKKEVRKDRKKGDFSFSTPYGQMSKSKGKKRRALLLIEGT